MLPLSCPVRGCHEPLHRVARSFACPQGHTYDIARTGYVNLLQPQDRRSLAAGDSRAAVDARAGLIAAGVGQVTIDHVIAAAAALAVATTPSVVVELGAGAGETIGGLSERRQIAGVGIDLSTAAASRAARRYPLVTWVVANADRRLPLLDRSADLVLSVHARRNPAECRRILRDSGRLLVAVPAANDLLELRQTVHGHGIERDRTASLIAEHAGSFEVVNQTTVRQRLELEREQLLALLRGTYRGERLSETGRVQAMDRLTVTLASDVVLFRPLG